MEDGTCRRRCGTVVFVIIIDGGCHADTTTTVTIIIIIIISIILRHCGMFVRLRLVGGEGLLLLLLLFHTLSHFSLFRYFHMYLYKSKYISVYICHPRLWFWCVNCEWASTNNILIPWVRSGYVPTSNRSSVHRWFLQRVPHRTYFVENVIPVLFPNSEYRSDYQKFHATHTTPIWISWGNNITQLHYQAFHSYIYII